MGLAALVSVVFIVKWSDVGAYFTGKSLGRNKLAPRISPGKTREGFVGGLLLAVAAAVVFHWFIIPWLLPAATRPALWLLTVYGLALAIAGVCGDLSVSMLKRDADRKDSGNWLPGLGGVLDVSDSLLWAAPLAYVCWMSGCFS